MGGLITHAALAQRLIVVLGLKMVAAFVLVHMLLKFNVSVKGLITHAAFARRLIFALGLKMVAAFVLVHMLLRFTVSVKGWSRVFCWLLAAF